ncbi:MAG: flagellar M-ring protein FliF [Oscillospiraceae bacterium]|jgi:flagellar M-ring protein FliF|nr:flagellar M-ring protein FliF [Oscillospiraceae bacterium]
MTALFSKAWTQVKEFFAKMERSARIRFGILSGIIVVGAIILAIILSRVNYGILYYNLPPAEAGSIIAALSERGVPYRTEGSGTILVPEDQISELLMTLSSEGYSDSTNLDFSIIENSSGFGATDLERQAYLGFQYQDNIRRVLMRLDKVENASVLISLPQSSSFVFARDARDATASVQLQLKNGSTLTAAEAVAIGEIVAAAAPGLVPENVRIVDSALNLYSAVPLPEDIVTETSDAAVIASQIMLETQVKQQLETSVVNLLTPVFGTDRVKVGASVTLNFDHEVSEIIEFAPPVPGELDGMIISLERIRELARDNAAAGGVPGTDSNGMGSTEDIDGTTEYPYIESDDGENYSKLLETINYELNRTTTQLEKARGTVQRLSIGVLIDSGSVEEDYTAEVRSLVAKAVGVSEDSVSVQRLPVTAISDPISDTLTAQSDLLRDLKLRDLLKTLSICITALVALGVVLLVIRGVLRSNAEKQAAAALAAEGPPDDESGYGSLTLDDYGSYDGMDGVSYMPGSGAGSDAYTGVTSSELEDIVPDELDDMVGQPNMIEQLERMIERDPKSVAQILRNWLTED